MARYFFHIYFDEGLQRDLIGLELPNLEGALAEARQARLEIMEEYRLDQLWLEILDESGRVVAKVG